METTRYAINQYGFIEFEWSIYVESENVIKSRWVQSERAYIAQLSEKSVFTIDINWDILKQIENITKQLKIFISYSRKDRPVYELIKQRPSKGYRPCLVVLSLHR